MKTSLTPDDVRELLQLHHELRVCSNPAAFAPLLESVPALCADYLAMRDKIDKLEDAVRWLERELFIRNAVPVKEERP